MIEESAVCLWPIFDCSISVRTLFSETALLVSGEKD